uniref:Uncharacterized protein n=1 Tax=Tanacetum cinerariifolium TaxID=118510 RepID=A0A699HR68_TANCI|nr:hypothetical protein [Tanacetum cinerariifolium]
MFIKSWIYLDDEYVVMTRNYFLQYIQLEILEFRDTLIQHMESVKKSVDEIAQHKQEYDNWVNERQMQTIEEKVDTSKALDASLVDTKSITTHYLPKGKESACAKPHHMIAPGSSRYISNDIVHNHYLEEAKKDTRKRWVPTKKIFTSSTTKVDSEPTNGSNDDITNQYECKQTLDVNAELRIHNHNNESSSSKLVPKVVPPAKQDSYITTRVEITIPPSHNNAELNM